MNEHFAIYESAQNDSFEKQVIEGAFTVNQLKELAKTASDDKRQFLKENLKYSGHYTLELIEELFFAPKQRGILQAAGNKVANKVMGGKFATQKAATTDKLINIYKQVWKEYIVYVRKQKGLGNQVANSLATAAQMLTSMGIDPKILNSVKATKFKNVNINKQVDDQTVGNFIYNILQQHYQGTTQTDYQGTYQLPQSV